MKYTIAFPAGLTAAVLLLCTGCAATQVRDRAYLQAIELRSPDTPTVLLHDFHESKAIAYGKGSSVSGRCPACSACRSCSTVVGVSSCARGMPAAAHAT